MPKLAPENPVLEQEYREDPDLSKFVDMLDGLAFLLIEKVKNGMQYLRLHDVAERFTNILHYFDTNYVTGSYRRVGNCSGNVRLRNIPPIFPPEVWNNSSRRRQNKQ